MQLEHEKCLEIMFSSNAHIEPSLLEMVAIWLQETSRNLQGKWPKSKKNEEKVSQSIEDERMERERWTHKTVNDLSYKWGRNKLGSDLLAFSPWARFSVFPISPWKLKSSALRLNKPLFGRSIARPSVGSSVTFADFRVFSVAAPA